MRTEYIETGRRRTIMKVYIIDMQVSLDIYNVESLHYCKVQLLIKSVVKDLLYIKH